MSHVFKIGDRAKVNCRGSVADGKEGVITDLSVKAVNGLSYFIGHAIDLGYKNPKTTCGRHVFEPHELIPIVPPKSQISEILAMKDLPNRDCKIARVGECV